MCFLPPLSPQCLHHPSPVRSSVRHCTRQNALEHNLTNGSDEGGSSPFGPLTQRLVAALIEENIMTPLDDSSELEKGIIGYSLVQHI